MKRTVILASGATVALILLLRLSPDVLALLLGMGLGVAGVAVVVVAVRFFAPDAPPDAPIPTLAEERAECDRKQAARRAAWEAAHAE